MEYKFEVTTEDTDLLEIFKQWKEDATTYHDAIEQKQKISEQYYLGNQTDLESIPEYSSNTVENRIFEAVETIVPVATANAHHFLVLPGVENEESVDKATKTQKVLKRKYETLEIQRKLEDVTRKMLLFRFGVLKWWWNDTKDDADIAEVDPRLIYVPKMRLDPHDLPYVIEKQFYSRDDIERFFPDIDPDELSDKEKSRKGEINFVVYETWTNEMVAWFGSQQVLDKRANPYWDFGGEEQKRVSIGKKGLKVDKERIYRNHLDQPQKPYVFFAPYNISDGPLPEVSLVETAIPLQDAINTQKRRIIDNLRTMGNGQVLLDSDAMSEEEAGNITNEPGLIIRGEGIASLNKVKREAGVPLPIGHFNNLQHSELVFDNLMGVHAATRGAAAAKTLGQDILSRQQDFTRIDLITRVLNRGVARVANGLVQLMKMYYTEAHVVKILGDEGAVEFVKFHQNDIEDNIEIEVRSGSDLPMDTVSLRSEAVQLWQLQALDPVTLFERLKFPNPEKTAERLAAWKMGQLTAETQMRIAETQAGATAKASAAAETEGGAGRGVETPGNVLQRARANLGGTAPVAPGTPKL